MRIEAPHPLHQSLPAQHFVAAGDAAVKIVGDVEEGAVAIGHPRIERKQVGRVQAVRARRDANKVEEALSAVRSAADTGQNLMPALIDAARVHATEGEIVESLQQVFGSYTETPVF